MNGIIKIYATSALSFIFSINEIILAEVSLSNNPRIPPELISVNGVSNNIDGSIIPFTAKKLINMFQLFNEHVIIRYDIKVIIKRDLFNPIVFL